MKKNLILVFAFVFCVSMLTANVQYKNFDLSVKAGTTITKSSSSDTGDHLSLIYDFDGLDFDYAVKAMVGINDSLYIICDTPDFKGLFFRIDENGEGYEVIWEFDDVNRFPYSLIANDTIIYGTTRFSANGGGTLFKYSLKDYTFEFIKDFDYFDVQEVQIKYITDSVLWLCSQWSSVDNGSIFTIEKDGNQLNKVYNDTNEEKGQNPVDFVFHNDSIYIAFFNGGGTPWEDDMGSIHSSGCFVRIKSDGTGYENIVKSGETTGAQPQSLIIRENKLIGLFAYTARSWGLYGQFYRSNLDGSAYDSLGALSGRALTRMMNTDSLIYGISLSQIFGVNPFNGEIRIFDDLFSNPDWGYDVVSNPVFLNGYVFFSTQQGGPDGGGTILRWTNQAPIVNEENAKGNLSTNEIVLSELFIDPEGDILTYVYNYNSDEISVVESDGTLNLTLLQENDANIEITASDGWTGYRTITITLSPTTSTFELDAEKLCYSESVTISYSGNATENATYDWDFDGGNIISGSGQGDYEVNWDTPGNKSISLTVTENGCSSNSLMQLLVNPQTQPNPICMVTVNELNKNMIVWELPIEHPYDSIYIYKESSQSDIYNRIGMQHASEPSYFIDNDSNPSQNSSRYKLAVIDTCGYETELSDYHKTIHLTINDGMNGAWNLLWDKYEGFEYSAFHIYRGASDGVLTKIAEQESNTFTYSDLTPPAGTVFYQIAAVNLNPCDVTIKKTLQNDYVSTRSNVVNSQDATSVYDNELYKIKIYPNPVSEFLYIETDKLSEYNEISILTIDGVILHKKQIQSLETIFNMSDFSKGIYILRIQLGKEIINKKIIKI